MGDANGRADQESEETWIQSASNPDQQIRLRSLGIYLENGGSVVDCRVIEDAEGLWTIYVRLSDRPGEHRVNMYKSDQPKTYRAVNLAVNTIRDDFRYFGPVVLSTERRAGGPRQTPSEGDEAEG